MWPGLAAGCQRERVPLVLVNARLNEKSLHGAQRLAWLARPAYRSLRSVIAQTEADASRLRAAGAEVTAVLGNLKFDVEPDAAQLDQGQAWHQAAGKPVVMLASSREGEEALWLQALAQLRSSDPEVAAGVQWLLVPRHPQRFDEIVQLLQAAGLRVSRRSQWQHGPQPADVWLGDSMGEMQLYYGLADVALLGGSFAPLGGRT